MPTRIFILSIVFLGWLAPVCVAQEPSLADIVKQMKAATVFVQVGERAQGSAFCVHPLGFLITNEHIVRGQKEVTVVRYAGQNDQEIVTARVLCADAALDLALLKADAKASWTSLPLGSAENLLEQMEVIAAGYPFGKELALAKGEYPSISINAGKISSLRMKDGVLERIQVDAAVNPGNSGGPLLDRKGKVIGVIVSGIRGAAVNFAIPISRVNTFVGTPEIEVKAPKVTYGERFKPAAFSVKTLAPLPSTEPYQVELILGPYDGTERSFKMKYMKGNYLVSAPPARIPKTPIMLETTLTYPMGRLTGLVADTTFNANGEEIKLRTVRSIRFGPEPTVTLMNARVINGKLSGLDELMLELGSDTMKLHPTRATELTIAPLQDGSVEYLIIVRRGGKELSRVKDVLAFTGAPSDKLAPMQTGPGTDPKKLDGLWVVDKTETKGMRAWPQSPEEAIYIEGPKLLWVNKNGTLPDNPYEANLEVQAGTNPLRLTVAIPRGPAKGQKWQVIARVEGDRLTFATNCDADRSPIEFSILAAKGGAQYVRTYRRVVE